MADTLRRLNTSVKKMSKNNIFSFLFHTFYALPTNISVSNLNWNALFWSLRSVQGTKIWFVWTKCRRYHIHEDEEHTNMIVVDTLPETRLLWIYFDHFRRIYGGGLSTRQTHFTKSIRSNLIRNRLAFWILFTTFVSTNSQQLCFTKSIRQNLNKSHYFWSSLGGYSSWNTIVVDLFWSLSADLRWGVKHTTNSFHEEYPLKLDQKQVGFLDFFVSNNSRQSCSTLKSLKTYYFWSSLEDTLRETSLCRIFWSLSGRFTVGG